MQRQIPNTIPRLLRVRQVASVGIEDQDYILALAVPLLHTIPCSKMSWDASVFNYRIVAECKSSIIIFNLLCRIDWWLQPVYIWTCCRKEGRKALPSAAVYSSLVSSKMRSRLDTQPGLHRRWSDRCRTPTNNSENHGISETLRTNPALVEV